MRNQVVLCGLTAAFLICGCAANRPVSKPVQTETKPYRLESEGQVPLDESTVERKADRVEVFEEAPLAGGGGIVAEDVELDEPGAPADPTAKTMPGYRVQVFASGTREAAESVRQSIAGAMGVTAYVEQIDGVYKVRIGDCASRPEAEELLQRCRRRGYEDAWIVASEVIYKRTTPTESG